MPELCPNCKKPNLDVSKVDTGKNDLPYLIHYKCKKCGFQIQRDCDKHGEFEGYQVELGIQEF